MKNKNPVRAVKNNIIYEARDCFTLTTPFRLVTDYMIVNILKGYAPVYFKRVIMKICGVKQEIHQVKYCMGYRAKNNVETIIWVDEVGRQIKE